MTISPELLEIAKANRNTFEIRLHVEYHGEVNINYDILEELFNGKMNDGDMNEGEDNWSDKEDGGSDFGDESFGGGENIGDGSFGKEEIPSGGSGYDVELGK